MSAVPEDFAAAAAVLAALPRLGVPELRMMFRLENAGETFYEEIAARVGHAGAAELLRKNAREERGHAERLRRAIARKLGGAWEPEPADLAPLTISLPARIDAALLAAIVQGELQGDAGYQRWADAEPDAEVQKLLRQNGREETGHARRVRDVLALLSA